MDDLVGNITGKVQKVVDKAAQLRALIAEEKVPLASKAIPPKPVLLLTPVSVANASTPQLTKAVAMPPLVPQPPKPAARRSNRWAKLRDARNAARH
jgi:hypothetical protein